MCIYFEPLQNVKAQEEYKRLVMQLERFTEPLYANRTHSKRRLNDNITDEEKITKILNKLEQMGTIAEAYKIIVKTFENLNSSYVNKRGDKN